jgi:hypothetical protein
MQLKAYQQRAFSAHVWQSKTDAGADNLAALGIVFKQIPYKLKGV